MGHQRLGTLPDTVPWRRVVALIAEDADAAAVAAATTRAAVGGPQLADGDPGLAHTVWLLAHIALASRQPDFSAALNAVGIRAAADPDLFDLVGSFTDAVDHHLGTTKGRTDVAEIAQLAAAESLSHLLQRRSANLFGTTPVEVKGAARELSTQRGFATLAHDFFARFAQRFLTYHLGRELSNHVGGNGRFADPDQHGAFLKDLEAHCREAALIVHTYAGGWYAKARFEDGVSPAQARRFAGYALAKLRRELDSRGARHG